MRSADGPWVIKIPPHSPAIWLYPTDTQKVLHAEVSLTFHGAGFMTSSTPDYNQKWRIDVDPTVLFNRYSSTYESENVRSPYLDYDGFRDGKFQTETGWVIAQTDLIDWQRETLRELGYTPAEIDDVNYSYARALLERGYKEKFFAIHPQEMAIVESSVSLEVVPKPDSVYRLWLYFVPVATKITTLKTPQLKRIERRGFSVVELAYLTQREMPAGAPVIAKADGGRLLGHRAGVAPESHR